MSSRWWCPGPDDGSQAETDRVEWDSEAHLESKVYEKKNQGKFIKIIADLTIGKGPFKATYKSDVRYNKETDKNMEFR